MHNHPVLTTLAALLLLAGGLRAQALDPLLALQDPWSSSQSAVAETLPQVRFNQLEPGRLINSAMPGLTLFGQRVYEIRCFFNEGLLARIEVSFYNKGDAQRPLQPELYNHLLKQTVTAINQYFAAENSKPIRQNAERPRYFNYRCEWKRPPLGAALEWAYTQRQGDSATFIAEYINLTLVPLQKGGALATVKTEAKQTWQTTVTLATLKKNVRTAPSGDTWIDAIPMIDQGQKGYCAVAVAERIFRYYGREIDQHTFAQVAETEAGGGTSFQATVDALTAIGKKYDYDTKSGFLMLRKGDTFQRTEFYKLIEDYNRAARTQKMPQIDVEQLIFNNRINLIDVIDTFDPALLKQVRIKQTGQMNLYLKDIQAAIDKGIPIVWSCYVGKYPETPAINIIGGGAFGHVRLIIGYNNKTKEILYSDTWGAGHELKRMSADTAWTITQGICTLTPRH